MTAAQMTDKLTLYHFQSCPYCAMVRNAIENLGLEIEQRDILQDQTAYDELVAARGTRTVPVLRIEADGGGDDTWMPESADIVAWLKKQFG